MPPNRRSILFYYSMILHFVSMKQTYKSTLYIMKKQGVNAPRLLLLQDIGIESTLNMLIQITLK